MDAVEIVQEKFRQKKIDAEYQANLNKFKVLENPEFKDLYNTCKTLSLEVAKAEYSGSDASKIRSKFKNTKKELYSQLKKAGVDIQNLYPKYECPKCKDTGNINGEYCECFKKALSQELIKESGLSDTNLPDFDKISYDIVKNKQQKENYITICKLLKDYINIIPNNTKHIVTLSGQVGVGKTYLLNACVNEAIKRNLYCVYTTAFNLNQDMLKYHNASITNKEQILEKYLTCELLCIDDLGTENILKNVTLEYLYLIINERLIAHKNTIITTNLTPEQIMQVYDERILSRIANKRDCILIGMTGDDLRLSGK